MVMHRTGSKVKEGFASRLKAPEVVSPTTEQEISSFQVYRVRRSGGWPGRPARWRQYLIVLAARLLIVGYQHLAVAQTLEM